MRAPTSSLRRRHCDLGCQARIVRDERAVRLERSPAALAVQPREHERRQCLAADAFAPRFFERLLDEPFDVVEALRRRVADEEARTAELPVGARDLGDSLGDSTQAETGGTPSAA